MITLSAERLSRFDACERRFFYTEKYDPKLISSLRLLYVAVEAAIVDPDPEQAAQDATMRMARDHELILSDLNAFITIRHIGFLAGIIGVALRDRLGILKPVPTVQRDEYEWESGLFETVSGVRHRIELVSHFDDDRLRGAAHSWRVIGELAALETPLTLTAVVIGPQRNGRRHSAWSKGLLHPVNRTLRFAPRNAKKSGFNDSWTKIWREQQSEVDTAEWLEGMKADDVLNELILSREIPFKDDNRISMAKRDMLLSTYAFEGVSENSPMRRSSCDDWGGCPFGRVCWSPTLQRPDDFPKLYSSLDTPATEPA